MFIMTGSSKDTYIGQYIFDDSEFGIWETKWNWNEYNTRKFKYE